MSEKVRGFFTKKHTEGRTSKSMFPIIAGVFTAFFLAIAICAIYLYTNVFTKSSIHDYETIDVENFVGVTYTDDLEKWFSGSMYYRLASVEYKYDENIATGEIISQSPEAGEAKKVLAGKQFCEVTLVVSGGEESFKLKDYTLDDYRLVVSELRKMGIKSEVTKKNSLTHEYGTVLGTEPAAGALLSPGDTIEIFISKGAGDADIQMPDFKGKTEVETLRLMASSKLKIGTVTYEKSKSPIGTVIKQSVEKGKGVYSFTTVDFVVSGGPKYGETETETTKPVTTEPETTEPETTEPVTAESETTEPVTETGTETETAESAEELPTEPGVTEEPEPVEE